MAVPAIREGAGRLAGARQLAGGGATMSIRVPAFDLWNATWPLISANSVWSRPMPTLAPGWYLVPRWRTRMLPASTIWPPKRLTPRRWPGESRPLRELPPAFLCAMAKSSGQLDAGDLEHRQVLPVAVLAARVLPPALLEDDDLGAAGLLDHLGGHQGARHQGRADAQGRAVADRQHVGELDLGSGVAREALDRDHVVLGDFVLFAAGLDDCEHRPLA